MEIFSELSGKGSMAGFRKISNGHFAKVYNWSFSKNNLFPPKLYIPSLQKQSATVISSVAVMAPAKQKKTAAFDHFTKATSVSEMQCSALTWQRRFSFPRIWTPSL